LSDSEFLPGWKKCPGVAETMIRAGFFYGEHQRHPWPDALLEILAAGGSGYHFFDKYADRIVIIKGNIA
jgi:hypothetical protein